jgi:hypothetical protein
MLFIRNPSTGHKGKHPILVIRQLSQDLDLHGLIGSRQLGRKSRQRASALRMIAMLPRLKSMDRFEAQRVIATLHSFRFFGLVFILPGVVGPNLPASFAVFVAFYLLMRPQSRAAGVLAGAAAAS